MDLIKNMNLKFGKETATHLPILIKLVNMTNGPILELGTGIFSTPYLHWACFENKRKLVSYEEKQSYFEMVKQYVCDYHFIFTDLNKIEEEHWSIVLVDQYPSGRKESIKKLVNSADYIVLHDSNDEYDETYKYSEIYPLFKYRYDFDKVLPRTTVVSNFKDLTNL
jgi:hypothetical protein